MWSGSPGNRESVGAWCRVREEVCAQEREERGREVDEARPLGGLRRTDDPSAVGAGAGRGGVGVLLDLSSHRDRTGTGVDVTATELEDLPFAHASECGKHDEKTQLLGHGVDDGRDLNRRGRASSFWTLAVEALGDADRVAVDQLVVLRRGHDRADETVGRRVRRWCALWQTGVPTAHRLAADLLERHLAEGGKKCALSRP